MAIPLGSFTLFEPIGRGGMGEVWRGEHGSQGVPVAVKVIRPGQVLVPGSRLAFENEIRQIARLDHSHIVLVLDQGSVSAEAAELSQGRLFAGRPFWVMEYASSGSLALELEGAHDVPLDEGHVRGILLEVLDALAHAHARGVIHRDIKPANILRCGPRDLRPGLKLSDFGLALDARTPVPDGDPVRGTLDYMAPEQLEGRWRDQGPWTDLYALGCVAYEMTTGRPPYPLGAPARILAAHRSLGPPPRPRFRTHLPRGFENWLLRLLAKRPEERPATAADARCALLDLGSRPHFPIPIREAPPHPGGPETLPVEVDDGGEEEAGTPPRPDPSQLDWRTGEPAPPPALAGAGLGIYEARIPPFVGREEERDLIWNALLAVHRTGRPRALVLRGPLGHGKRRLARWMGERAAELGIGRLLTSQAGARYGLPDMLARHFRCEDLGEEEVAARVEEVLRRQGGEEDPEEALRLAWLIVDHPQASNLLGGSGERYQLVTRALARLARERPVILVLEEAGRDRDALELARHLLDAPPSPRLPVLLLLTASAPPLPAQEIPSLAGASTLEIGPLDRETHAALVRRLLALDERLVQRVVEQTAGNPLFAVELLRDWVKRRVLHAGEQGFVLPAHAVAPIPASIRALWGSRLRRVLAREDREAARALQVAAVLGREVDWGEWEATCRRLSLDLPPPRVAALVQALAEAALVESRPDGWAFGHEMLRESIEQDTPAEERHRFHRACAEMLQEDAPPPSARRREERIGRHRHAAGDWAECLDPLFRASRERLRISDYWAARELLDLYQDALARAGIAADDVRWAESEMTRLEALISQGQYEVADLLAIKISNDSKRFGPTWSTYRYQGIRRRAVVAQKRGDFAAAEASLSQARALASEAGNEREVAACCLHLGTVQRLQGYLEEALRWFRTGRDQFADLGDELGQADCLSEMATAALSMGRDPLAEHCLEEAEALYQRHGHIVGLAYCQNTLGDLLRHRGDPGGAEQAYHRSRSRLEAAGSRSRALFPMLNLGLLHLEQERWNEAEIWLHRSLDIADRMAAVHARGFLHAALLNLAAHQGDWQAWDEHCQEATRLLERSNVADPDVIVVTSRAARLARERDQPERASGAEAIARVQKQRLGP